MILVRIGVRNLWLHKWKTLIVGGMLLVGTAVVIFGNAVLDAVDHSRAVSLVNSVAGHIQIYSDQAVDDLELFGGFDSSRKDIGVIRNFPEVKRELEALDNVKTVVPMGIDNAIVVSGNVLDRRLATLRDALRKDDWDAAMVVRRHVQRIVGQLKDQMKNLGDIADMKALGKEWEDRLTALSKTAAPGFWDWTKENTYERLEFLENEVAKLAPAEDMVWLSYVGTDTELFRKTFDRFQIVKGTPIPAGKRGFLFSDQTYERIIKNKTARRIDRIQEKLNEGETIASCEDCQTWVKQNVTQAANLAFQLDELADKRVVAGLQAALGSTESQVLPLLEQLLKMDDGNYQKMKRIFYDVVAPNILLYSFGIGDTIVITSFQRGGSPRTVPLKIYGTYSFESLDKSPLAGGFNMMDLMSFRELYGFMTADRKKEIDALRKKMGVTDVSREEAEADLFGEGADVIVESKAQGFDETAGVDFKAAGEKYTEKLFDRVYTREEIEGGLVLNAAVMLKDGDRLEESMAAILDVSKQKGLGLRAIDWRKASGLVGEFVGVIRIVLYAAVFIIFVVALIIINNSMVMATMDRTREIGTMRAIGAQRGFVMRMFLLETAALAVIFGGLGAAIGAGVVLWLSSHGIGAWSDITVFLFAGPRLYLQLTATHLLVGVLSIALVGILSTFYPARLATRIEPVVAMRAEE